MEVTDSERQSLIGWLLVEFMQLFEFIFRNICSVKKVRKYMFSKESKEIYVH